MRSLTSTRKIMKNQKCNSQHLLNIWLSFPTSDFHNISLDKRYGNFERFALDIVHKHSGPLPKANSSPLQIGRAPKGKYLPTIIFQGRTVSFRDCSETRLGGGFKYFWYFHPDPWGNDPFWRAYFSNGLKPPTRREISLPTLFLFFFTDFFLLKLGYNSFPAAASFLVSWFCVVETYFGSRDTWWQRCFFVKHVSFVNWMESWTSHD